MMSKVKFDMIRDMFNEPRNIVGYAFSQNIVEIGNKYGENEILVTDTDEIIVFSHRLSIVFDEEELARYIELAEEIFDKVGSFVSIFILGEDMEVVMDECTIPSNAVFTIKLCVKQNPINRVLSDIERRIANGERLRNEEIEMVSVIPMMVSENERKNVRVRCLKIMNNARL